VARGRLWIGTSGWHYAHWVGPFYPAGTRPRDFLAFYARSFRTVEVNNSFYRLTPPSSVRLWVEGTPPDFLFAVKANRFITHRKKLKDAERSTRLFFDSIRGFGRKLGPILFQLPPRWNVDVERLATFLEVLPRGPRYAFELRDETWFRRDIYDLLRRRGAAFCVWELAGRHSPVVDTAPFAYVRLHGPGGAYQGSYDGRTLRGWARRIASWRDAGRDVHVYFDNDERGYAAADAARLQSMCLEDEDEALPGSPAPSYDATASAAATAAGAERGARG
jgi:uncharacterized protein YecE (DUF72 family)